MESNIIKEIWKLAFKVCGITADNSAIVKISLSELTQCSTKEYAEEWINQNSDHHPWFKEFAILPMMVKVKQIS